LTLSPLTCSDTCHFSVTGFFFTTTSSFTYGFFVTSTSSCFSSTLLELSKFTESLIAIKFHYGTTKILVGGRYSEISPRDIQLIITRYRNLGMGLEIHRIVYQLVRLNKGLENLKLLGLDTLSVKELGYIQ
jgi:hypothetical protein